MAIRPIGPDVPAVLQPLLNEMRDAAGEQANPTYPHLVFATTTALQPSAADYQNCIYFNTTIKRLAVSDGTNWLRMDTGAAI